MRKFLRFEMVLVLVALFASCKTPTPKDLAKENLIPKPTTLVDGYLCSGRKRRTEKYW